MNTATIQLESPFFALLAAPSHAGKSTWCQKLVRHADQMISPPVSNIIWCYTIAQPWMKDLTPKVTFHQGMIDITRVPGGSLLLLDDLQQSLTSKDSALATKISHHKNISVVYITQNLFYKGSAHRDLSLNANYIILFKNPRDKGQASVLARQLYPGKTEYFMKSYSDATEKPYGYLLINLRQTTPESLRLCTNIFPGEKIAIYLPADP